MKLSHCEHLELMLDPGWRGWIDRHEGGFEIWMAFCTGCRTPLSPGLRLNPPLCMKCAEANR